MDNDRSYETTDQILHWFSFSKSMSNTNWILDLNVFTEMPLNFRLKNSTNLKKKGSNGPDIAHLGISHNELNGWFMAEICI